MKSSRIVTLIAIVSLFAVSAFAASTTATTTTKTTTTKAAPAKHAMSHGIAVRGSITAVDQKAKTFDLKEAKGVTVKLAWNDATKMTGSALATGEQATVRYMVHNGQKVATVINARPVPKAAAKK